MRLRDFAQATTSRCSAEVLSGRYRLDGRLGWGGAADVHRGFDLLLRRPVAVKIFRPDSCIGGEESLDSEARILARLHHPGLVTAFDAGQHEGRSFLVMQLIEGITLKERIAQGSLLPDATAALGSNLAQALGHAHETGIVHRDIKPSNILLDHANRPHLADFGISRGPDTTHTATGTLIGTPAYLSPEQVLGRPVGRPADIYALGLVLLECLTGKLEYDGGPLEAAIARLHRPPVLPPELPERLSRLLRKMTALDEQDRPPARDCVRELIAVAHTALVPPAPSTSTTSLVATRASSRTAGHTHANPMLTEMHDTHPRPPARRRRTLVAGTTAALTAVVATALGVTGTSAPQNNDRTATRATGTPSSTTDAPDKTGQKRVPAASPTAPLLTTAPLPTHAPAVQPHQGLRTATSRHSHGGSSGSSADGPKQPRPMDKGTSGASPGSDTAPQAPSRPPGQTKKKDAAENKARQ
ncbi:serine/threonine-protein kinase [Streptomyces sp. NPDC057429]|uniref:serine/threonine-protein kinase n=1 Tax=Streptomyces sp. NPDC057429 TaxID=3346130 RepID=UPI00369637AE